MAEMIDTKKRHDKNDGRQYKHYIQSFAPGETTAEQAHTIGLEWAEKIFPGFEVYVATHANREHIHNHFIVNSVNWETGKKLHLSKRDLQRMKNENDRICIREGLSIPERKHDRQIRSFDQGKYQLFKRIEHGEKVKSYVLDTALAVERAAATATNRVEFIQLMKEQGFQVNWQEQRKHVTFIDPTGHKVRLANLEKTFNEPRFSKEGLVNEFAKSQEQSRSATRDSRDTWATARDDQPDSGRGIPKQFGADVARAVQHATRAVEARTNRATGRDTAETTRTQGFQRNSNRKHRTRNRELERER